MNCLGEEKGFYQDHGLEANHIWGKGTRTQRKTRVPRTLLRGRFQKECLLWMPDTFWSLEKRNRFIQKKKVCLYPASGSCTHLVKSWWICGPNIFSLSQKDDTPKLSLYSAMKTSENGVFKWKHMWAVTYSLKFFQEKWKHTAKKNKLNSSTFLGQRKAFPDEH